MLITSAGYKRDRNNFSNLSRCYVNLPKARFSIYVEYCLWEKLANWLVIKRKLGSQPRTKPLTENQIASLKIGNRGNRESLKGTPGEPDYLTYAPTDAPVAYARALNNLPNLSKE